VSMGGVSVISVGSVRGRFYLSPASLEFTEGAEKDELFFKKSVRGRFFKTTHASGGDSFAMGELMIRVMPSLTRTSLKFISNPRGFLARRR